MGSDSKIEWTDHTFNPWRGCTKVSPGCTNCYAEQMSHRNPAVLGVWGDKGSRAIAAESYWGLPLAWDRSAKKAGVRRRVFCASLADVFEDRPELVEPRGRLLELIQRTPHLDWLLLTKRPEGILDRLHETCRGYHGGDYEHERGLPTGDVLASAWCDGDPPENVWLGISVEDQARADERIPHLLAVPAAVRFMSMEPLLGPVDLNNVRWQLPDSIGVVRGGVLGDTDGRSFSPRSASGRGIDWVIVGGESGPDARPMHPDWARSIRDQCQAAGVAFHFKQWGEWIPWDQERDRSQVGEGADYKKPCRALYPDGRHLPDLSGRGNNGPNAVRIVRVGKKAAGRMLDGRTWDELPAVGQAVAS